MGPNEILYCPSPDTTEGPIGSRPAAAPSQARSRPRSARGGPWRTLRRVGCVLGVSFLGLMGACAGLLVLVAILAAGSGRADLSSGGLGVRSRTVYVESLPSDVDRTYQQAVSDAITYWHQRLGSSLFRQTATAAEADIQVSWVKEWAGERAGMTADRRVILVGLGDSNCLGRWRAYAYDTVKQIAIHELGHVLGMGHSPNPADPMYPVLTPKYDLMVDEDKVTRPAGPNSSRAVGTITQPGSRLSWPQTGRSTSSSSHRPTVTSGWSPVRRSATIRTAAGRRCGWPGSSAPCPLGAALSCKTGRACWGRVPPPGYGSKSGSAKRSRPSGSA